MKKNSSRLQAENAILSLLNWIGEDTERDGLKGTPARVVRAYEEFFSGYSKDPEDYLKRTFEEVDGYDGMVLLRGISFVSHCEHHILPIIGKAYVAYIPRCRIVGISKLARVVDAYAKRLQIQEKMTVQIANVIDLVLNPVGIAVIIEAEHQCMSIRGIKTSTSINNSSMITSKLKGAFKNDSDLRSEFLSLCGLNKL